MISGPNADGKAGMIIALDVLHETASMENTKAREFGASGMGNAVRKPEHVWAGDQIRVEKAWDIQVTREEVPRSA